MFRSLANSRSAWLLHRPRSLSSYRSFHLSHKTLEKANSLPHVLEKEKQVAGKSAAAPKGKTTKELKDEVQPKPVAKRRSRKVVKEEEALEDESTPNPVVKRSSRKVVKESQNVSVPEPVKRKRGKSKAANSTPLAEDAAEQQSKPEGNPTNITDIDLKNTRSITRSIRSAGEVIGDKVISKRTRGAKIFDKPGGPRANMKEYARWVNGGGKLGPPIGDTRRQNILSASLCDDILERLKPSLEKHKGCDILDLNPGYGVWSEKLHDHLKPRKHILMEPDQSAYQPALKPLADAPNSKYELIFKSGIVWSHLDKVLAERLPLQVPLSKYDPNLENENNTLLVTANLGSFPAKSYLGFHSLASMVLYQFTHAIQAHSLFQQYGLVRMLIWLDDEEKALVLPRNVNFRKKAVLASDITSKIHEVASTTEDAGLAIRNRALSLAHTQKVMDKMAQNNITTPPGRESIDMEIIRNGIPDDIDVKTMTKTWGAEFAELVAELPAMNEELAKRQVDNPKARPTPEHYAMIVRHKWIQNKTSHDIKRKIKEEEIANQHDMLIKELQEVEDIADPEEKKSAQTDIDKRLAVWYHELESQRKELHSGISLKSQNIRAVKRFDPPLLMWDRRDYEPLRVNADEFIPQRPMCLLDIQPTPNWTVFRGDDCQKNLDLLEYITGSMFIVPKSNVRKALEALWPGAYEYLVQECPSLSDPKKGGYRDLRMMGTRELSSEMLHEIMDAWIRWPWQPTRYDIMHRLGSSYDETDWEKIGE